MTAGISKRSTGIHNAGVTARRARGASRLGTRAAYSVHPGVIGRRIEVAADLDRVQVFCDGKTVADHERVWAWHQSITDPEHRAAANMLRHNHIGALRPVRDHDDQVTVEQRCLADYDTALGIDLGEGGLVSCPPKPPRSRPPQPHRATAT
jgi:hypothetical protein